MVIITRLNPVRLSLIFFDQNGDSFYQITNAYENYGNATYRNKGPDNPHRNTSQADFLFTHGIRFRKTYYPTV